MFSFLWSALWWIVGGFFGSWFLYLVVFSVKPRAEAIRAKSKFAYYALYTVAMAGYAWDIFLNVLPCSIIFWDWPRELTITYRLRRYLKTDTGWRWEIADWMCTNLLEIMDTKHCGR